MNKNKYKVVELQLKEETSDYKRGFVWPGNRIIDLSIVDIIHIKNSEYLGILKEDKGHYIEFDEIEKYLP